MRRRFVVFKFCRFSKSQKTQILVPFNNSDQVSLRRYCKERSMRTWHGIRGLFAQSQDYCAERNPDGMLPRPRQTSWDKGWMLFLAGRPSTTLTTPGWYVATSKTDQLGQGVDVVLGRTAVNNSHNPRMVCCHVQDRPAGTRGGCCSWQDGRQQPSQSPDGMLPHPAGTRGGCCLLCWAGQPSSECGVWCLQMEF